MDRSQYIQERKLKKKRRRRILFTVLLLLLIGGGFTVHYLYSTYASLAKTYNDANYEKSKLREEDITITKHPFSLLIMGIEDYSTGGTNGRTDSLLFATVNPADQTVKLMSIPRDTRVVIVGKNKKDKINHAHAFGGEKMTIETVENFLNVPVDYYVKVNFEGFKDIVDAVDGITVDVPFDFWERSDAPDAHHIYFKKGNQHLNGEEALAYVRMRKRDPMGDYGRTKRQRQALAALIDKLNDTSSAFKIKEMAEVIGDNIQTNIKISQGVVLAAKFSNFSSSSIQTVTLKGEDARINGLYYFVPNAESLEQTKEAFSSHLQLPDSTVSQTDS
ncbi:LCP family protein [Bacillus sp. 165]|uniref:LCP family protein n=1 Tax=Bacillus sp. 165 TaxID=1529117 RepID=UPI001ADCB117|nr:LCP family protein [Bacillus sp. 165]MBO9129955.1 LCP family protein [Bacillus sp. 165]